MFVAGGITTEGTSDAVYEFDPASRSVRRIGTLPFDDAHAPLAALDGALYLIGGDGHDEVVRISTDGDSEAAIAIVER